MTEVVITSLVIYPVKSFKGIPLERCEATSAGLLGDRQWAVFKSDNHALTQRQSPEMALITPKLIPGGLKLKAPGFPDIDICSPNDEHEIVPLTIWKDVCPGQFATSEANAWLTEVLKSREPLKLAKIHANSQRQFINPERFGVNAHYFSDAAPFLLSNEASLESLNTRLKGSDLAPVDMRHFRPNIVVSGISPFAEHQYKTLTDVSSESELKLIDHCQRCSMITVNPDSGKFIPKAHPFAQLAKLNAMPDNPKAPAFGVNCTLAATSASMTLRVGQKMRLH